MNGYLNHFVAPRNNRVSVALGELTFMIPRCRSDQSCRSILHAANRLWNLLPSGVFSGDTLSSFKSACTCAY